MTEIPVPVPKRCKFELVLTHAHLVDVPQIALVCPLTVISTKHQWLIDCR